MAREEVQPEEIVASYKFAKLVHDAPASEKKAVKKKAVEDLTIEMLKYRLPDEDKVGGIAYRYINNFEKLMQGEAFKYAVKKKHLKYHLEQVLDDYGEEQAKMFLDGIGAHIDYRLEYTKQSNGKPAECKDIRLLHNEFSKSLGIPLTYESHEPYKKI